MHRNAVALVCMIVANLGLPPGLEAQSLGFDISLQSGVNCILLTSEPLGVDGLSNNFGARDAQEAGFDFFGVCTRHGDRFFVEPGAFVQYTHVTIAYSPDLAVPSQSEVGLVRTRDVHLRLLFGAKFFEGRHAYVRASFGPAMTIPWKVYDDNISAPPDTGYVISRETYTDQRYALVFDVGVDFRWLQWWSVDASYDIGLSRIYKRNAGEEDVFENDTKESVFRFHLGWLYRH